MKRSFLQIVRSYGFLAVAIAAFAAGLVFDRREDAGPAPEGRQESVSLVYVNWAEGIAMTNLVKVVLEDRMGYHVTMTMADPAPLFTSLASGDKDAFVDAWLPVTHGDYMDEYGDRVNDLGPNYRGARVGLVVPEYVQVNTIPELADHRDLFEGEITGIDSGAGIMKRTETAIDRYGLEYELMASSGPAMTTSLKSAIRREAPVVVTGWRPHWMFARWKLKFLDDPKGVYGREEDLHTITRSGLAQDMPKLVDFLKAFELDSQQLGSLMGAIQESSGGPEQAARGWAESHDALVASWLP